MARVTTETMRRQLYAEAIAEALGWLEAACAHAPAGARASGVGQARDALLREAQHYRVKPLVIHALERVHLDHVADRVREPRKLHRVARPRSSESSASNPVTPTR